MKQLNDVYYIALKFNYRNDTKINNECRPIHILKAQVT